ncbi:MAG: TonB-dependent receptor [Proteobacteria bacterium]|nr:TonB-dependent receptor [Desulfobacula sp.]MBU3953603.1 TonB-dependent receptor [Pseudomonadota bacterium]MBU4131299.1 TonB-dependent receptor [Pseudomonadota bacterium]
MKVTTRVLFYLILLMMIPVGLVLAAEEQASQVFDLGQVLVVGKSDKTDKITTIDVVSMEDIKMQGAQTAADALELVPGVDIQTANKGQASLKLRGFDQRDVKLLIDGVPAHVSYNGSLDLSQIPVDTIARIEVVKGASSVLYGPNTMGGVINIITKKGGAKPYTQVSTSFGENNTQNYVANHGGSVGKFNYWITGSHRESDGFELSGDFNPNNLRTGLGTEYNEDGGTRDLSYYDNNTFNSKIGYEYDASSKLYLSFDYHDNKKGCPTETNRYWEFDEWKQWHLNLVGEHDFTDILTMKARAYYVDHNDSLKDVSWDANHTTKRKWFEESSYDDYTLGGDVQAYLDFGDASLVKMGITYMKDNHIQQDLYDATTWDVVKSGASVGLQPEQEYEVDVYSVGIEDEVRFFEKLLVKAGVSYDVHDPIKAHGGIDRDKTSTWNPQTGIAYDVTDDFNLYASVGKKTRFPQMQELYSTLSGGNKDLKPQKTIAYEIGGDKRFGEYVTFSAAVFFNDIQDRIVNETIAGVKTQLNKGETDIKGIETSLRIMTPWRLDVGLGYTYLTAKERADSASAERDAEFIPEHKATLDARYAFDFGLSASFQTIYTGEQTDYDNSNNPVTLDDFVLCNFKLNQEFSLTPKLSTNIFIEVKNIFDEDYEEGHGPLPGRGFLVGASLTF